MHDRRWLGDRHACRDAGATRRRGAKTALPDFKVKSIDGQVAVGVAVDGFSAGRQADPALPCEKVTSVDGSVAIEVGAAWRPAVPP